MVAPPGRLGVLRTWLSPATARLIEVCDPYDGLPRDIEALRDLLRRLRARA